MNERIVYYGILQVENTSPTIHAPLHHLSKPMENGTFLPLLLFPLVYIRQVAHLRYNNCHNVKVKKACLLRSNINTFTQ